MAICCKQCGAALTERDAFCTKCGAPRETSATQFEPVQHFCTKCGAPLTGTGLCTKCGAVVGVVAATGGSPLVSARGSDAGAQALVAAPLRALSTGGSSTAASGASAVNPSGIPKALIVGAAIIVVFIITLVTGVTYVVHRVKRKAAQIEVRAETERGLTGTASNEANASTQDPAQAFIRGLTPSPAVQALRNRLNKIAASARDIKTQVAVDDLRMKLAKSVSQGDLDRTLGEINAAADSLEKSEKPLPPMAQADIDKSFADAALVANAIIQNPTTSPDTIPRNALPSNMGKISAGEPDGYTWVNGGVTYTWSSEGLIYTENNLIMDNWGGCLVPKPVAVEAPAPETATGVQAHDWALKYERTVNGPEADLVVRTGDINNLGFGWPKGFDPFSGRSTPGHHFPWVPQLGEPAGTDRIMIGSVVARTDAYDPPYGPKAHPFDGYSGVLTCDCPQAWPCQGRRNTMPQAIRLEVGALPAKIHEVVFQIFADDFQPAAIHSHFQVSVNGTRIPAFEYAINSLDQSGPIGKLLTLDLLPEYWPLLKSGEVKLFIDDPTTHVGDGYAVDFVRILVNPHNFKYQVSLTATVTDADKHIPIAGATVNAGLDSSATDKAGKCELKGIPAGLVVATASAPGYDENSVPVDLPAGQNGNAEIPLHRHQESTAALEQSIAQTGEATIYGIHFDAGSSKLRSDSLPALNAVLGLIKNHADARWIISGHTDNQGSDQLNIPLSKARAASVVSWLKQHGVDVSRLEPQGFGSTRPVADNSTANGRFLNRRVGVALAK